MMTATDGHSKRKTETLNLRIDAETRSVIARAADARRTSLTAFMTEAAYAAAQKALLDQRFLSVDAQVFDAVEAILPERPRPQERLTALLREERQWID